MLAVGFAVALTVIVSMWMGWTNFGAADPPQTDDTRADANRSGSIRAMVATAKPDVAGVPQYRILSGETIEISIAPQRGNQPVAFSLGLGEPSRDDEPRAVRLIATDGRILELNGALAADRMTAAIEVPAEFLSPGRYLVEMTTTEATHFPLRRFVVVVRSTQAEPQ